MAGGAGAAGAAPYSYSVGNFFSLERGFSDDFSDGTIAPDWFNVTGNVVETNVMTFSNPGVTGTLIPGVQFEASTAIGFAQALDGAGSFAATSIWLPDEPSAGSGFNLSIASVGGSGLIAQASITVANTTPDVAAALGTSAGLSVNFLEVLRAPSNEILSVTATSQPFLPGVIDGQISLRFDFDDATNQLQAIYSLDNGATIGSFAAIPWNFAFGSFGLGGSTTFVPEPGTATLVLFGLTRLATRRQRTARRSRCC